MSDTLVLNTTTESFSLLTGETVIVENFTTDLVSEGVIGPPGAAGLDGSGTLTIGFAYGDASPVVLTTVAANKHVYRVDLYIETTFDGTGATLSVGRVGAAEELLATTDNLPGVIANYRTNPDMKYGLPTVIGLYIAPGAGASQGTGQVRMEIEP